MLYIWKYLCIIIAVITTSQPSWKNFQKWFSIQNTKFNFNLKWVYCHIAQVYWYLSQSSFNVPSSNTSDKKIHIKYQMELSLRMRKVRKRSITRIIGQSQWIFSVSSTINRCLDLNFRNNLYFWILSISHFLLSSHFTALS